MDHLTDGEAGRHAVEDVGATGRRVDDVAIDAGWPDADDADANIRWVEELRRKVQPHLTGGACVNFLDDEGPASVRAAYGANYARLVAIKRRYDPGNLFRVNQNIDPIR